MGTMRKVLSQAEAHPDTFHDCHVQGIHWAHDTFRFSLDIHYILECIAPDESSGGSYRLRVAEAQLVFDDVSEVSVSMDWSQSVLDAEMYSLSIVDSRLTPGGASESKFEIEFSEPSAFISVWSPGYRVILLGEPVISNVPLLEVPSSDEY